jgi:hypothetical protein
LGLRWAACCAGLGLGEPLLARGGLLRLSKPGVRVGWTWTMGCTGAEGCLRWWWTLYCWGD